MPSTSAKQEKFMRAVAHGWKPTRMKDPPSRAVATEFMEADKKYSGGFAENRYYTGGLAVMNMQDGGEVYTPYGPGQDYSAALRAHRERVASSLAVPEGGYARGGHVENYQEGGAARAGHAEGANPYPEDSARYKLWERKNHVAPAPPPVAIAPEAEDIGWLDRLLGRGEDIQGRSEHELEEMGEAYGGYVDEQGYQYGGLAQAGGFRGPPRGGVPPHLPMGMMNPRGGIPPGMQKPMPWRGAPPPRIQPGRGFPPGKGPRMQVPPSPPRGLPGRGGSVGGEGPGIPGGPRVPPNMRGFLQRQRMMNRPPANVGGGVNRVGQQDQQGGLARALQRGTGRPPMSRRAGFPGRNVR